ncbi:MAG TPA: phosphatidylcholine/phosphatidylserine synthase [Terriglobales bacterium]|nr:phosphatidylcholine/phosphatidylserine synthase [Terriglobales bacterium]
MNMNENMNMEERAPHRREADRPRGKLRKGMYILPSLFTTANIAAGFYAILQTVHGSSGETWHMDFAAMAIGFAVLFDGIDGRIARMTHTESDFGRELDSLADVITFGVAPALLAWMWGFHLLPAAGIAPDLHLKITQLGSIACFAFLIAGASRLARFNIAKNPQPSNPGRPGKKYFVGMPIPAGAGVIAAVVHFSAGEPVTSWVTAMSWLMMVIVIGYLMVSTWRFYSFKDINFRSRRPFRLIVLIAVVIASIWYFSRLVLFVIAILYMASGVLWRLQWIFRRKAPPAPPAYREASHTP